MSETQWGTCTATWWWGDGVATSDSVTYTCGGKVYFAPWGIDPDTRESGVWFHWDYGTTPKPGGYVDNWHTLFAHKPVVKADDTQAV